MPNPLTDRQALREIIEDTGLTLRGAADLTGLSVPYLSKLLSGDKPMTDGAREALGELVLCAPAVYYGRMLALRAEVARQARNLAKTAGSDQGRDRWLNVAAMEEQFAAQLLKARDERLANVRETLDLEPVQSEALERIAVNTGRPEFSYYAPPMGRVATRPKGRHPRKAKREAARAAVTTT